MDEAIRNLLSIEKEVVVENHKHDLYLKLRILENEVVYRKEKMVSRPSWTTRIDVYIREDRTDARPSIPDNSSRIPLR